MVPALLAQHPPRDCFSPLVLGSAHFGRIKHGLSEVLHAAMTDRDHNDSYGPMVGAIDALLRACETAGDFVRGTDPEDVLLLLGFLWRIAPGAAGEARADRLIDLVMRGLSENQATNDEGAGLK